MLFDYSVQVVPAGFQTFPEWVYSAPAQNAPIEQPTVGGGSNTAIVIQGHLGQ